MSSRLVVCPCKVSHASLFRMPRPPSLTSWQWVERVSPRDIRPCSVTSGLQESSGGFFFSLAVAFECRQIVNSPERHNLQQFGICPKDAGVVLGNPDYSLLLKTCQQTCLLPLPPLPSACIVLPPTVTAWKCEKQTRAGKVNTGQARCRGRRENSLEPPPIIRSFGDTVLTTQPSSCTFCRGPGS